MKKSRFSDEQIIGMIKEQENGMPTAEVWRDALHGRQAKRRREWMFQTLASSNLLRMRIRI